MQCGSMNFSTTHTQLPAGFFANAFACSIGKRALLTAHHLRLLGHILVLLQLTSHCHNLAQLVHHAVRPDARAPTSPRHRRSRFPAADDAVAVSVAAAVAVAHAARRRRRPRRRCRCRRRSRRRRRPRRSSRRRRRRCLASTPPYAGAAAAAMRHRSNTARTRDSTARTPHSTPAPAHPARPYEAALRTAKAAYENSYM